MATMNNRQLAVLWIALTIAVFMAISPPVLTTVHRNCSGAAMLATVVSYKFAFAGTATKILYGRLFLELLIVLIVYYGLIKTLATQNFRMISKRS